MNKLLNNPSYRSNTGYSGNDLSHTVDFSSSVGMVLPISWDFLQPGDKVNIQARLKTRTQPLISAAMGEIEEHVRTFFVPVSQIYKPYEQLYNGIQDYGSDFYNSVIVNNRLSDVLPIVSLGQIFERLKSVIPSVEGSDAGVFYDTMRLLECLGVPIQRMLETLGVQSTDESWKSHSINLLPFMSYQKIWYDYFRDTDRVVNDPTAYNYDSWVDSSNHVISEDRLSKFFFLRYCPCTKDVTNNLFVSPLFGENGVGGDNNVTLTEAVNNWLTGFTPSSVGVGGTLSTNDKPTSVRPAFQNNSNLPSVLYSTASIRSGFALNKLLEITRRAHKHYDSQILAHFGVNVPNGINGECFEIGHHVQDIQIGDVISTADTAISSNTGKMLGEIGGKGYSHDVGDFKPFEAKTHGVLMTVYYSRPRYVYEQTGIDKKLAYSKISDIPRPEYDELGMQPKFMLNMALDVSATRNSSIPQWEYRYSEVKTAVSRAILGLNRGLKSWTISKIPQYVLPQQFYVAPTDINQIMEIPYTTSISSVVPNVPEQTMRLASISAFDSDPFINQLRLVYKKTSKLSTYGLADI